MIVGESIWAEKYRPNKVADVVLPESIKEKLQRFVDKGNLPNLIFSGSSGCGKTTVAKAMLEELGCDYIVINGSLDGNIDTLRVKIKQFASAVSMTGGRKYVILDEADYLNPNSTQPALRNFMEEFSKNCGFILTCNYANKILQPLRSRCSHVEFKIGKEEKPQIAAQFFKKLKSILEEEGVEYEKKTVVLLLEKHFPDFRKILNEVQYYSSSGMLSTEVVSSFDEEYRLLFKHLKEKNFTEVRKWVTQNNDIHPDTLFSNIYSSASEHLERASIAQLVLILADYQYKQAFVANPEINTTACLTEIMAGCVFK
jgi:DNA polymerase III delta prime subunit